MKFASLRIILAALVLSGCSRIPYFVLFNNSGFNLSINSEGLLYSVPPGTIREIRYPGNTAFLEIEFGSGTNWNYQTAYPDKALMNGNTFSVQVESSGVIHVIRPGAKVPTTAFPPQPDGFPWRPNTAKPIS
jgi:hypothetical protein